MNKLNMVCPLGGTGYGIASLNILKELTKLCNISLFPLGSPAVDNQEDATLIQKIYENQSEFDINAPCLKIWHQFDLASTVGKVKSVAFPFFELDSFTKQEIAHLSSVDELIVSSSWAKKIIEKNKIEVKTSICQLGVDRKIFTGTSPVKENEEEDTNKPYVFLNVGKWEKRKGHDILIDAFSMAFEETDNVELWLVPFNPFLTEEEKKSWHDYAYQSKLAASNKVKIFNRLPNHTAVAEVMSYSDCGIFPSRGEGWNLEALEMMSSNKPVIITNYSSHTEFCNSENSFLIEIEKTEKAMDNKWFNGQGDWATIGEKEMDQMIGLMRKVYTENIKGNSEGIKTADLLSWENAAKKINKIIF